jgi:lysophospholipase L1-like esterase
MYKGGTALFLGDSITFGTTLLGSQQYATYVAQIQQAIYQNYGNCKVINKAISGWASGDYLVSPYYWSRMNADLIVIHIGTNDCGGGVSTSTFQTNLEKTVDILKKMNPNVEIILCSISRRGDSFASSLDPYRTVIQTVATEKSALLCRFEDAWVQTDTATYTASDLLHPNYSGHQKLFNVLWPVIQQTSFVTNLGK